MTPLSWQAIRRAIRGRSRKQTWPVCAYHGESAMFVTAQNHHSGDREEPENFYRFRRDGSDRPEREAFKGSQKGARTEIQHTMPYGSLREPSILSKIAQTSGSLRSIVPTVCLLKRSFDGSSASEIPRSSPFFAQWFWASVYVGLTFAGIPLRT